MNRLTTTTLGVLLLAPLAALHAADFYVATNGNDTNRGTKAKPLATIQAGVNKLQPGDTLLVRGGVYRDTIRFTTSGTVEKPILIAAEEKGTVTIRGSAPVTGWRRSEENNKIFLHDGWDKFFGKWDESLVKGGDPFKAKFGGPGSKTMAFNQVYVNGILIREVACPERRQAGTFYIDREKKQIHLWLADDADPNQHQVEVTDRAVLLDAPKVSHLHVKGLNFEHCANGLQQAAVDFRGGRNNLIEDCSIRHTAMVGLSMAGDDHVVRRCVMNHNGQQGFSSPGSENVLIEDSETSFNNLIPWKRVNVGFQAGGFKVAIAHRLKFLRHTSIGNHGPGLWFDISNDEMQVANCYVADNLAFGGVMNEISYRIHIHDSVFVNNKGGGVLIAEAPGALIERNIMIGNEDGVNFRDMPRSTAKVSIIDGRSVKGEKVAIWNHDEVVRHNVFLNNTRAQVNFGINGINANRQAPKRLLGSKALVKSSALTDETRLAQEYMDKRAASQQGPMHLAQLNFVINGNVYWGGDNVPLMRWGSLLTYQHLAELRAGVGFEKDGVALDPQFADWKSLDLRVPADSRLLTVLNGSQTSTNFVHEGTHWVIPGQTNEDRRTGIFQGSAKVEKGWEGSTHCVDVFVNNGFLRHVEQRSGEPGTYYFDYAAARIYLAADPAGKTVEVSLRRYAFDGSGWSGVTNVTIRNLTVEKYANGDAQGAIMAGPGWIIEGSETRLNHGAGIEFNARNETGPSGGRACRNYSHHNGARGIGIQYGHGILIESNETAFNNQLHYGRGWNAAGIKNSFGDQCIIRGNFIHDNSAKGIWIDCEANDNVIEDNQIVSNASSGITVEISIRNTVRDNRIGSNNLQPSYDHAEIYIQSCGKNEVCGNQIDVSPEGDNGVCIALGDRRKKNPALVDCYCHDNWIHNNTITYLGKAGESGVTTKDLEWESNRFDGNTYHFSPEGPANRFNWGFAHLTFAQFQAKGQEKGGSVSTTVKPLKYEWSWKNIKATTSGKETP